jgi:glycosyltransferase involved in cell wall biosynthesis
MRITFVTRENEAVKWGGDLKTVHAICDGLNQLGHQADTAPSCFHLKETDFVFLTSTCLDLRQHHKMLRLLRLPYGIIAFHEDAILFFGPAFGFYHVICGCLQEKVDEGFPLTLDALYANPELIRYYAPAPRKSSLINYEVLKDALLCIANTPTEARTLLRDCPSCNARVVPWAPGFAEEFHGEPSDAFLKLTGLASKEYLLQVGRLEVRKNQLASIIASRDLDAPLVLVATRPPYEWYTQTCLEAIRKWRKGPTWIVSQTLPECDEPRIKVIRMPQGEKISSALLHSAFAHAGLHLHPAAYELPGATYFESAALGVPTIASSWTTIRDYFHPPLPDDRIAYCAPFDLPALTALIHRKMGESYPAPVTHPAFCRTRIDVARDLMALLEALCISPS